MKTCSCHRNIQQVAVPLNDGSIKHYSVNKYLLEAERFKEIVLEAEGVVFVAFWDGQKVESREEIAQLERDLENNVANLESAKLVKVDINRHHLLAKYFKIKDEPTVLVFENGKKLGCLEKDFTMKDLAFKTINA